MDKKIFVTLFEKKTLSEEESYNAFRDIMEAKASPVISAAFLSLLRMKGEQPAEIAGAVRLLREKAVKIKYKKSGLLCDTCGTGGDNSGTFNISTCTAILASACGLTVAKHGNRSITSKCGSADVLESLGYKIDVAPDKSAELLAEHGFAFLFAPLYHKAMKNIAPVRKELGFKTIFNIIGPLCNPARSNIQIMGVNDYNLIKIIPSVFHMLGIKGYVVHSEDGIDEISLTGRTYIAEVSSGRVEEFEVYPQDFGFKKCRAEDLKGGEAETNARIILDIAKNKEKGPMRDIVLLNTAFLLKAHGRAKTVKEGITIGKDVLQKQMCIDKFNEVIEAVNK